VEPEENVPSGSQTPKIGCLRQPAEHIFGFSRRKACLSPVPTKAGDGRNAFRHGHGVGRKTGKRGCPWFLVSGL
jgi:hypothetical protein